MTRSELNYEYFDWMYDIVTVNIRTSYRKLLRRLHDIDFTYSIPMDGNRANDGIDLRYRFGRDFGCEDSMIADYLDDRPCSVLEMLIALAIRCDESIMYDPDAGDRTSKWFWIMIDNLGLTSMYDSRYDSNKVDYIIQRLLMRDYKYNGEGGLFVIRNCNRDLRSVEIWYQLCWYLDSIL